MTDPPMRLVELIKWLEMKDTKSLGKCSTDDIFDLGQQIADDVKNHNLHNGFVIYDNGGKIRIISMFKDKTKKAPMSKALIMELSKYILEINK